MKKGGRRLSFWYLFSGVKHQNSFSNPERKKERNVLDGVSQISQHTSVPHHVQFCDRDI